MKLKLITIFIIIINVLLLLTDIPKSIVGLTIAGVLLSLFIQNKKTRAIVKIILLITSVVLLRMEFQVLLVTECGVSFALLLSSLKFWELNEERDHFNMFLILALCECCIFLIVPTFLIFILGLGKMFFYFYYILKIRNYDISLLNPKRLLILIAPSMALSVILFYTFPRFTQGFINTEMQYIISGGNSRLNFKELGPLSTSSEQAFRVYGLDKSKLPFNILYWRSSVLWQQNAQEWSSSNTNLKQDNPVLSQTRFKYDIEILQNMKEYLPTLSGSSSIVYSSQNFNYYGDESFKLKTVSRGSLNYTVVGNYADRSQSFNSLMRKKGLRLRSARVDEIKNAYFQNSAYSENDGERLKELVQIFQNRSFQYSLTPPAYNSVEGFLLNGKYGYCSHFAAAFTYLARVYNLPARMVNGYLGGELNPYDGSIIVRERDAHMWVEVFIQDSGWVRVDPTGLVAPARIRMSADEFNQKLDPYITIFNFKIDRNLLSFGAINQASLWLDSFNSKFYTNIFNFDRDKQLAVLRSFTPRSLPPGWIFSLSLSSFMFAFWLLFYFFGKESIPKNQKRYLRFLKRMKSFGVEKDPYETISQFKQRCLLHIPAQAPYIDSEVAHYIDSFYK